MGISLHFVYFVDESLSFHIYPCQTLFDVKRIKANKINEQDVFLCLLVRLVESGIYLEVLF